MERLKNRQWLVVYTKPRGEKKLVERLLSKGIEAYCPVQKTLRQWSDRKKSVMVPVFTSYIFVRITGLERSLVIQDPLALKFIYWLGAPAVIRDSEMKELKLFVNSHSGIQVESLDLKPGATIEITDGPFKGESAIISEIKGSKVRLFLNQIGCRLVANVSNQLVVS